MTDADLARWEAEAMRARGALARSAGRVGRVQALPEPDHERVLALVAEVRRLRAELQILHGMTTGVGRDIFPSSETRAKRQTAAYDGLTYYPGVLERDDA